MRGAFPLRFVAVVLLVAGLATACSEVANRAATGPRVSVTERDFHISAPTVVPAGDVVISAHNTGPDAHELILIRRTRGSLPLRPDGITVDEDAVEARTPGALEPYQPGMTEDLTVHLTPGRYVFICNMSGHYLSGMHADIVVR